MAVGGSENGFMTAQAVIPSSNLVAQDQTSKGKFKMDTEVKPILAMTQANWIAVREWNGNDLIYVLHLWAWRCGLIQIEVSLNGVH